MTKIKDVAKAKLGVSGMFGGTTEGLAPIEDRPLTTREEIEETLGEETREALRNELQRRQYLKAGRPPKGSGPKVSGSVRMTFLVSPEKQRKLRDISLRKGLFICEVLDRGIDLVIAEFEREEGEV